LQETFIAIQRVIPELEIIGDTDLSYAHNKLHFTTFEMDLF